jgi:hypothetical protein
LNIRIQPPKYFLLVYFYIAEPDSMHFLNLLPLLAALPSVSAAPKQPEFSNTTTLPTHFGLLVFPQFQALDVFGPMDVFNTIEMLYRNSTTMHLSILSKTMAPVSTKPNTPTKGNFGQSILPTITFSDYLAKHPTNDTSSTSAPTPDEKGPIEVLIVPGGAGTRQNMTAEIDFVRTIYPNVSTPVPPSSFPI